MHARSRLRRWSRCWHPAAARLSPRGAAAEFWPSSDPLQLARTGAQETPRLDGAAVPVTKLPVAEHHNTTDTGGDDGRVVAVHHAAQPAVERHLFLVVAVHGFVETGRVDYREIRSAALA